MPSRWQLAPIVMLAASTVSWTGAQKCEVTVPEWAPRGSADTARPRISATLTSTCGAAIDVSSVRMTVDKQAVKPTMEGSDATVTVVYVPPSALLEEADHTVAVQAQDEKGVPGERTWTFHVPDTYLR
jgi:glucosamine 6-phosphate synthetase-like amidotransferase/phosphosugar isomerase protein